MVQDPTCTTVSGQSLKIWGTAFYLYGSIIPRLKDNQAHLLFGERFLQPDFLRKVQTITLPQPASAHTGAGGEPLLFYYPFGYAFVQYSLHFGPSGLSQADEQSFLSLLKEEKDKNDRLAVNAFSWLSSRLSLPFAGGQSLSNYMIVVIEHDGGGVGWTPQMLELFQKTVHGIPVKKAKDSPPDRKNDPIQITLKSKETLSFESEHGLIAAEPKNIDGYLSTVLFSLALDQRLKAIEGELERQHSEAFPYLIHVGKVTYKSLALQEKLQEEAEKAYSGSLVLVELSKCLSDPKSIIPRSLKFDSKIYSVFKKTYQFEDRKEVASECVEALQDLFDTCGDRISEFKYFFYEAILETIIILVLFAELIFIILLEQ